MTTKHVRRPCKASGISCTFTLQVKICQAPLRPLFFSSDLHEKAFLFCGCTYTQHSPYYIRSRHVVL